MKTKGLQIVGVLVCLTALILTLAGCGLFSDLDSDSDTDPHGLIITVTVPDGLLGAQGEAGILTIEEHITAEKVKVTLTGQNTEKEKTEEISINNNGISESYEVAFGDMPADTYDIKAKLEGYIRDNQNDSKVLYEGEKEEVKVGPDELVEAIIKVNPKNAVSLKVTLEDSKDSGILDSLETVSLKHPSEGDEDKAWSNADGNSVKFEKTEGYAPGRWQLHFEFDNTMWVAPLELLLLPTEEREITLDIGVTFDLTFDVKDGDNNPIEGADVELTNIEFAKLTDVNGEVVFENLLPTKYDYKVSKEGYETKIGSLDIVDKDKTVEITLGLVSNASISPEEVDFNLEAPADVETTITWNAASEVVSVEYEGTNLDEGNDYTVKDIDGDTARLTILKAFFDQDPELEEDDELDFTIEFDEGEDAVLTVKIIDTDFAGGSGTEGDPYKIEDWNHLNNVRNSLGSHFELVGNLDETSAGYEKLAGKDANNEKGWEPIGDAVNRFHGFFDGNRHTIKDLYIYRPDESNIGLFGHVGDDEDDTIIKNVCVKDADITGGRGVGALIGRVTGNENTQIEKCCATGTVKGTGAVGGLIGSHNSHRETDGGFDNPVLRRSFADVEVSEYVNTTEPDKFGGLVGCSQKGTIENSYARGPVTVQGSGERIGGLVGCVDLRGELKMSYSTGLVTAAEGSSEVGALVGGIEGQGRNAGRVESSYSNEEDSGQDVLIGDPGVGIIDDDSELFDNAADMKGEEAANNMDGFDFVDIWETVTDPNDDYPVLQWQNES